jgi:hypothetical protein
MTVLAQLVASDVDNQGYTTYVFKCLEDEMAGKYIMCTRYPNWNHRPVKLGEIGFLTFSEVVAGVDTWYNGKKMIPYRYSAIQFLKFLAKPKELSHEYVM